MSGNVTIRSWHDVLSFYDSLTGPRWNHIRAFRELIAELSSSIIAAGLTAVTSHEVLTLSPYTRYPDWFQGRRIQLHPLADGHVRIVKYSGWRSESWTLPLDSACEKILVLMEQVQ